MRKFTDESGNKYWCLTLISLDHKDSKFRPHYRCKCDCGNEVVVRLDCIKSGNTKSCGCLNKKLSSERLSDYLRKHDGTGTRLYKIWGGMKYRCSAYGKSAGKHYADRGVSVCKEWKDDFMAFRDWALQNGYSDNLSLDRIDVNGNYEPSNCRWATIKQQARNKTNTKYVLFNGEILSLKDATELFQIPYHDVWQRINRLGWSAETALSIPVKDKTIKEL